MEQHQQLARISRVCLRLNVLALLGLVKTTPFSMRCKTVQTLEMRAIFGA